MTNHIKCGMTHFFLYDGNAKSEEYGYESEYILIMDDAGKEFIDKLIDSLPDSKE